MMPKHVKVYGIKEVIQEIKNVDCPCPRCIAKRNKRRDCDMSGLTEACEICRKEFTTYPCRQEADFIHTKFCQKCNQSTCEIDS